LPIVSRVSSSEGAAPDEAAEPDDAGDAGDAGDATDAADATARHATRGQAPAEDVDHPPRRHDAGREASARGAGETSHHGAVS
jgi:hypothetical protein